MIYVAGYGLITAVGPTTPLSIAAVSAGANAYRASNNINKNGAPMITAQVPEEALAVLPDDIGKISLTQKELRLIRLSIPALHEAVKSLKIETPIPLFLAGPESSNNRQGARGVILKHIAEQSGVKIDVASSRYLASGRAGVIEAIDLAYRYFSASSAELVLVGGVDSYLDAATLGALDAEDRVTAENVSDGFAPGEAAGFLLLSKNQLADFCIGLHQPSLGKETGAYYSDEIYRGDGLAKVVSGAIAFAQGKSVSRIYSSMNGQHYFAKEYGVSVMRNSPAIITDHKIFHPADCWGDIGAATGIGLIALSASHFFKTKDDLCHLVYGSSDGTNRAAVCVERV